MIHRVPSFVAASCGLLLVAGVLAPTAGAKASPPAVLHVGKVSQQDIPSRGASEPDTLVEPDVAVSPLHKNVAIAVAHDSRFADGGAVGISVAWTNDGGAHWHHRPVPGITTAVGGPYQRASDPVVTFGPGGSAYLSVLLFNESNCKTAVGVLRSTDGGQHWSKPHYAHKSATCDYSDDKNWLVVDNSKASPHYGRLYQFWTPFRYQGNRYLSAPQAVRWSDDKGVTWSKTTYVTPINHGSQNSQPMILPNGSIVDTFYDFGPGGRVPDVVVPNPRPGQPRIRHDAVSSAQINAEGTIFAATSTNGGAKWSPEVEVTNNGGGYADGVRCCLFAADIDAVTAKMHVAWEGGVGDTDPVYEAYSSNGRQWSSPIRVSRGDVTGLQRVNVDVVARGGNVYVAYGTRTDPSNSGGFVQQQLSVSNNGGRSFAAPSSVGPRSVLKYAAQADGYFPGDYIGEAITADRLYAVWAVSSKPPPYSASRYHQLIYGATWQLQSSSARSIAAVASSAG
jgi:hypothetical protein